jgi:LmbE family N-acetylglucosaminyl deacetylase
VLRRGAIATLLVFAAAAASGQEKRTILAIGAHAGDMELTAGALLAKEVKRSGRAVILHLTVGEGGNPKLSTERYGEQKRAEATEAAATLGVEVLFGPYRDGEVPDSDEARRYVAGVIRRVRPTHLITHWRHSIHKDHVATSAIVRDAWLLASLEGVVLEQPAWRGVRSLWYAENWEDADRFLPYIYVDVTGFVDQWRDAVSKYEFVRGTISSFAYLDYYSALAVLRGAEARKRHAVAFDIDAIGKRRILDDVP